MYKHCNTHNEYSYCYQCSVSQCTGSSAPSCTTALLCPADGTIGEGRGAWGHADKGLSHHLPDKVVFASVGDLYFKHVPHQTRFTLHQHLCVCRRGGRGEGGGIIDR